MIAEAFPTLRDFVLERRRSFRRKKEAKHPAIPSDTCQRRSNIHREGSSPARMYQITANDQRRSPSPPCDGPLVLDKAKVMSYEDLDEVRAKRVEIDSRRIAKKQ